MIRTLGRHLLALVLALHFGAYASADDRNPFPEVAQAYLIEMNGKVLWEKNADEKLPLASLTKLLTAIIVIENTPQSAEVTVSRRAAAETGTKLGLRPGEKMPRSELLEAALLNSANDACYALAESVNSDQSVFTHMMNERAVGLGMSSSHFTNPCGHDNNDHYSTARDLRLLAKKALSLDEIRRIVSKSETQVSTINTKRTFNLKSQNALLGRSEGVYGLKTGYTPNAGKCLIAAATRNRSELLLIFLNAPDRWWDAYDIIDIAFKNERRRP